jgi:hypothetical protein
VFRDDADSYEALRVRLDRAEREKDGLRRTLDERERSDDDAQIEQLADQEQAEREATTHHLLGRLLRHRDVEARLATLLLKRRARDF